MPHLDANGVDIIQDTFSLPMTDISIGPKGPGGLTISHASAQAPYLDNYSGSITIGATPTGGQAFVVQIGMSSDLFANYNQPSEYGTGASLTLNQNISPFIYTYTASDGTQYIFNGVNTSCWQQPTSLGLLSQILYPSGDSVQIAYTTTSLNNVPECAGLRGSTNTKWARRQSVQTSTGYQATYAYNADTVTYDANGNPDTYSWGTVKNITLTNNAAPSGTNWPSVTYGNNPVSGLLTETNANGDVWTVQSPGLDGPSIITVQTPIGATYTINGTNDPAIGNILVTSFVAGATSTTPSATWIYTCTQTNNMSGSGNACTGTNNGSGDTIRTLAVKDPFQQTTTYVSDVTMNQLQSVTDPLGHTTTYSYNPIYASLGAGMLASVTYPEGNQVQYQYDGVGNVTQTTQVPATVPGVATPASVVTLATYPAPNTNTNPASCANPVVCHKPLTTTDAGGNVTTYCYDIDTATNGCPASPNGTGNLLSVTGPAGSNGNQPQTRFTYKQEATYNSASVWRLTAISQCASSAYTGTPSAPCTSTTDEVSGAGDEIKTTIAYGPAANLSVSNVLPISTKLTGPGDSVTTAFSATTTTAYDNYGNATSVTSPIAGQTTVYVYDGLQRVVGVMEPLSQAGIYPAFQTQYNHDGTVAMVAQGTVTNQQSWSSFASLQQQSFSYDGLGRKIQASVGATGSAAQTLVQYSYDTDNRPVCAAIRMNPSAFPSPSSISACTQGTPGSYGPDRISQNNYDSDSRLTSVYQGVGTSLGAGTTGQITAQTWNYNPSNNLLQSVADANSNTTSYVYDGLNRQHSQTWPISPRPGATPSTGVIRQLTYDNLGRITSATANGRTLSYTYNALGLVTSETQPIGTATEVVKYAYDAAGRLTKMTWPDSFSVSYAYSLTNRLIAITKGASALALTSFWCDTLDRPIIQLYGNTSGGGTDWTTASATFKVARGMSMNGIFPSGLSVEFAGTPADNIGYAYTQNPAGQIVSETHATSGYDVVNSGRALFYTANALNQTTFAGSTALGYDGLGDMTSNGTTTYGYDALSNLLASSAGGSLTYDPLGRIASATSAAGTTSQFLYSGNHVIAEYSGTTVTQHYVFGPGADQPLVWYTNGTTGSPQYLIADLRGSIVAVSDSNGDLLNGTYNTYDEYGTPSSGNNGRFQYTGQMWMPEVGLYSYKARLYSPALGRFVQTDPAGYGAGMNLYAYAGNDPINNADPSGMACEGSRDLDPGECTTINLRNDQGSLVGGWYLDRGDYKYADGSVVTVYALNYQGGVSGGFGSSGSPFNLGSGGSTSGYSGGLTSGDYRTLGKLYLAVGAMFTPFGEEAVAAKGVEAALSPGAEFFAGASYTQKVLDQMGNVEDLYHGFPSLIDSLAAESGVPFTALGRGGGAFPGLLLDGSVNGTAGSFEWIMNAAGQINHRLFVPGG